MNVTMEQFLEGSLVSSISHAIMTNLYPELSYEQSWDGCNFSMNNGNGIRGTVTFLNNRCIGAIRNERSTVFCGHEAILELIHKFPRDLIEVAKSETLQYLLEGSDCGIQPGITSAFWCDSTGLFWASNSFSQFSQDFELFKLCTLPKREAIVILQEYYGMGRNEVELLKELLIEKADCFFRQIVLTPSHKERIPGASINDECRVSLRELNIIC